jgi:Xaa-Pro dipeptidase
VLDETMSLYSDTKHVSADVITLGCRMVESDHELQLMHKANEVTLAVYHHVYSQLELAMTQNEIKNVMNEAQPNLGGGGS